MSWKNPQYTYFTYLIPVNTFLTCLILPGFWVVLSSITPFFILKEISFIKFTLNYIVFWGINCCAISWKCNENFQYSDITDWIDPIYHWRAYSGKYVSFFPHYSFYIQDIRVSAISEVQSQGKQCANHLCLVSPL